METKAADFINNLLDWINSVPGHQWYVAGVVVASIPAVIAIVEWVKRHHVKVNTTELENHFIALNVVVWSSVMTVADFVLTNGDHFSSFFPFLRTVMPVLSAAAPVLYSFSKAAHSWFVNRENEDQKQRLAATLKLAGTMPTSTALSNGSVANGINVPETQTPQQQAPDLLQL